ncbi:MAG TPA: hypothetical protein VF013_03525 [Candidatus Limnocylindria bacterium]
MSGRFDPRDAGLPPDLDSTLAALDGYAADSADLPSPGFADRVMQAVAEQPAPARGLLALLLAPFAGRPSAPVRLAAVLATATVAVVLVVAAAEVADLVQRNTGGPPASPSVTLAPSPSPTATPTPSATPSATPSVVPTSTPETSPTGSAEASASDDHHESDESKTPEPSETPRASDDSSDDSSGGHN